MTNPITITRKGASLNFSATRVSYAFGVGVNWTAEPMVFAYRLIDEARSAYGMAGWWLRQGFFSYGKA